VPLFFLIFVSFAASSDGWKARPDKVADTADNVRVLQVLQNLDFLERVRFILGQLDALHSVLLLVYQRGAQPDLAE